MQSDWHGWRVIDIPDRTATVDVPRLPELVACKLEDTLFPPFEEWRDPKPIDFECDTYPVGVQVVDGHCLTGAVDHKDRTLYLPKDEIAKLPKEG